MLLGLASSAPWHGNCSLLASMPIMDAIDATASRQATCGTDRQYARLASPAHVSEGACARKGADSVDGQNTSVPCTLRVDVMELMSWAREAALMNLDGDRDAGALPSVVVRRHPPSQAAPRACVRRQDPRDRICEVYH